MSDLNENIAGKNDNQVKRRRARTKKEQLDILSEFHNSYGEVLSNTHNPKWEELVIKLNSIGPPDNTSNEWKRVWTEHKYNKKRKQTDASHESNFKVILVFQLK